MKRFLISLLVCSCVVCSVSADSVLFTPHHISSNSLLTDNIAESGIVGNMNLHVDSDGKSQTNISEHSVWARIKIKFHPVHYLEFQDFISRIFFKKETSFSDHIAGSISHFKDRILFPFHYFL